MSDETVNNKTEEQAKQEENRKPEKKKSPLWLRIIGIILLVVLLFFAGILFFIDGILTTGVRTVGTQMLGVKVHVDAVRLKIFSGELSIKNLQVANPPGCAEEYAFVLPAFYVSLNVSSLMKDKIIIDDIRVEGLEVNYEPDVKKGSNINRILDNMKKSNPQASKKTDDQKVEPKETVPSQPSRKAPPEKKVAIDSIQVKNSNIKVTLLSQTGVILLPDFEMEDIGEKDDVTISQAIYKFLNELMKNVTKASTDTVGDLEKKLRAAGQDVASGSKDIGQAVKEIGKEIKNMFSGEKKEN